MSRIGLGFRGLLSRLNTRINNACFGAERAVDAVERRDERVDKWLLIKNVARHKKAFAAARVPFTELKINAPRPVNGLAFPEEDKARALEILGLSGASLVETSTDQRGVFLLEMRTSAAVGTVEVHDWDGKNRSAFVKTIEDILVPAVGDVVLAVPHGRKAKPAIGRGFHIHIWSSPAGSKDIMPPKEIWGIGVNCRDEGFGPSGQGTAIVDPDTGWAVGELVGNNLYVHHDLCHSGTDNEIRILRRLCEEAAAEIGVPPEERSEHRRKSAEAALRKSEAAYVKECEKRLHASVAKLRAAIQDHERIIKECQSRITESVRSLADAREELERLLSSNDEAEERFAAEFERLRQASGVVDVTVEDGIISVFTENIEIPFDGEIRDIGEFRIDILTSGANGGVRCVNLTRRIGDCFHPHVRDDGSCCLGNIAAGVAKLIGECEYSVLAQIMIQYLQNYNPGNPYLNIKSWPVVKRGRGQNTRRRRRDETAKK